MVATKGRGGRAPQQAATTKPLTTPKNGVFKFTAVADGIYVEHQWGAVRARGTACARERSGGSGRP